MNDTQKYTKNIKDVEILDKRLISQSESHFTFIYNDASGMHVKEIKSPSPVVMDRIDAFSIQDETASFQLPVGKINSLRSFAASCVNFVTNLFSSHAKALEFDGTLVFDTRSCEPNNIAHLMCELIPLCLHIKNNSNIKVTFIFAKIRHPFINLPRIFGIEPVFTTRKIKGKIAKVFTTRGFGAHQVFGLFDSPSYRFIPNIYDDLAFKNNVSDADKIFIARRGSRGLSNLVQVEEILNAQGYKTIFMEDYSMEEQLGIASAANEVVAVHGASMGMLTLRKNIKSIIEIMPPNAYHDYFPVIIGNKTTTFVQIMTYFDERIPYNGWETILTFKNNQFSVDINQLNKALEIVNKDG